MLYDYFVFNPFGTHTKRHERGGGGGESPNQPAISATTNATYLKPWEVWEVYPSRSQRILS